MSRKPRDHSSCALKTGSFNESQVDCSIYNYNASQDVELSLQIGDTVHILEMYEGECNGLLWPGKSP
ncbi:hypothetical protein A6R68_19484 [Neotoma lepida]|uniref:SH3 domain-containing protein n=1 Tax=Neotoma lepida TaxID=56216 RepID=A0A1A6HIM8_NEOLE|nr:hypothetical protein A6R68_19484 [Neotoma lepida]